MFQIRLMSALCICVCVADGFDVLVNRAVLSSTYGAPKEVEYRYVDGDRVDVTCLSTSGSCAVKLTYHYWGQRFEDFDKFNYVTKEWDAVAVGLRTTLRAAHHRTRLTCEHIDIKTNHQMKINVTFVLDQTANDVLYMKINGYVWREQTLTNSLTVFYTKEENVRFDCGSDRSDVQCDVSRKWDDPLTTSVEISPPYEPITNNAWNSSGEVLRTVTVTFKPLPDVLTDYLSMSMNSSDDHILLHLYHSGGRQLVYYEFDPGLSLSMTCTLTQPELVTRDHHSLMFGDTGPRAEVSITKELKLSASDKNRTEDCRILHQMDHSTVSLIRVLFYMTRHGDAKSNSFPYWMLGVAGLAVWVIAAVFAVYLRRRHLHDQRQARLSTPGGCKPDNVYCEGQPIPRVTAPLPTAQESSPDLIYADLDMTHPAQHTRYHPEESPYAEVLHL